MKEIVSKLQFTFLILVLMFIIPVLSYAVDGQRKISQTPSTTFPITINQPGSYVLTSNLVVTDPNATAIEITDSHITFDLNGHMIRGPNAGGTGSGISSMDGFNITIKNGSIWGFGLNGIILDAPVGFDIDRGYCVKDIQSFLNGGWGIYIKAGLITNCTANSNGEGGIHANYATVTNCTANNNTSYGFSTFQSTITNCTAISNEGRGISDYNSTITNCTANDNTNEGIVTEYSIITNCTASGNLSDGIRAINWARIEANNLRSNGLGGTGYGLNITGGYSYAVKNVAYGNMSGNFQNSGSNNIMPFTGENANYWSP